MDCVSQRAAAKAACRSSFHFIRAFGAVYGPYTVCTRKRARCAAERARIDRCVFAQRTNSRRVPLTSSSLSQALEATGPALPENGRRSPCEPSVVGIDERTSQTVMIGTGRQSSLSKRPNHKKE